MPASVPPYREKKVKARRPNRWAIGFIVLFFISTLVLLFFQSSLSKVQHIEIEGNMTLDDHEILGQISLAPGLQFFEWDREAAKNQLMKNAQVKEAHVTKSFPGKIIIAITEWRRVAFRLQEQEGGPQQLRPVLENGTILSEPWTGKVDRPLLRGWEEESAIKEISAQLTRVDPETLRSLSEIHPQKSNMYEDAVRVFTDEGNEVITRIATFQENINQYKTFIESDKKGIVHMTYGENFGWFEPYEKEKAEEEEKNEE